MEKCEENLYKKMIDLLEEISAKQGTTNLLLKEIRETNVNRNSNKQYR